MTLKEFYGMSVADAIKEMDIANIQVFDDSKGNVVGVNVKYLTSEHLQTGDDRKSNKRSQPFE